MSQQSESPKSITSGETLAAWRRVKISGTTVIYADAGEAGIGVVQAVVSTSGDQASIRLDNAGGTSKMMVSGAISAGANVYPAADGKVSASMVGEPVGKALEAATADGDVIEILTTRSTADIIGDSARSRTAVQLPTAAIWNNFNIPGLRENPWAGSLLDTDFTHPASLPDTSFVDATYAAAAAGKSITEGMYIGTGATGELLLFSTTDHQSAEGQWSCPITSSGGNPWAFGFRVKLSVIADTKFNCFVGLMVPSNLVGNLIVDAGTLQTEGSIGFQVKEGDGDKIDVVYDKTGQSQNEHSADWCTPVAGTYNVVEMYFDGTDIHMYLDGTATGTAILAADISGADFPGATIMVPSIAISAAHADDFTLTCDWARAAQTAD